MSIRMSITRPNCLVCYDTKMYSLLTKNQDGGFTKVFEGDCPFCCIATKGTVINGWLVIKNRFTDLSSTKRYLAFHPAYTGRIWEEFDSLGQAVKFCTIERLHDLSAAIT